MSLAKDTADPTNGTQYGIELGLFSGLSTWVRDMELRSPVRRRVNTQIEANIASNECKGELYKYLKKKPRTSSIRNPEAAMIYVILTEAAKVLAILCSWLT